MLYAKRTSEGYVFKYQGRIYTTPTNKNIDKFVKYIKNSTLVEPGRFK